MDLTTLHKEIVSYLSTGRYDDACDYLAKHVRSLDLAFYGPNDLSTMVQLISCMDWYDDVKTAKLVKVTQHSFGYQSLYWLSEPIVDKSGKKWNKIIIVASWLADETTVFSANDDDTRNRWQELISIPGLNPLLALEAIGYQPI